MDKVKKLEMEIKELNAKKADYRKEVDDAEADLHNKKTSPEHVAKMKLKSEEKARSINERIVALRQEVEALRGK